MAGQSYWLGLGLHIKTHTMTVVGFGLYWLTVKNLFIFKPNPMAILAQMPTRVWLVMAFGCVAADTFHEWQYPQGSMTSHIPHQ
tara:strand:- start:532 stop:783 length:252 start_codon:yes stop_codon:yes gene_type:complete